MTPSTIVRRPRGPFTFVGLSSLFLEREAASAKPKSKELPKCIAHEDDGRVCGLPARYVDFKLGGHVCYSHRPNRKQEALTLV